MESITSKLRARLLLIAAVPHILLMLSQSLIAIVDTVIVAPIGIEAIAAVGLSGFIFAVLTSGLIGIMISVQSISGRAIGQQKSELAIGALQAGLLIALIGGSILIVFIIAVPALIHHLASDAKIVELSIDYLSIMLISAPAIGVVRAFRGFLAGIQYNFLSLLIIIVIYLVNIMSSIIFVNLGYVT